MIVQSVLWSYVQINTAWTLVVQIDVNYYQIPNQRSLLHVCFLISWSDVLVSREKCLICSIINH